MTDETPGASAFEFLSNEYAQALQAWKAIENQAGLIASLGGAEELVRFIDQFIDMAERTRVTAQEHEETNFIEWFTELIRKAKEIRLHLITANQPN